MFPRNLLKLDSIKIIYSSLKILRDNITLRLLGHAHLGLRVYKRLLSNGSVHYIFVIFLLVFGGNVSQNSSTKSLSHIEICQSKKGMNWP